MILQELLGIPSPGEQLAAAEKLVSQMVAINLFVDAISQPFGVNDESQPDYKAIAEDCVYRASETTHYLFEALRKLA
jgi:hypothetical protein